MKKILLIGVALLTLIGCSKTDEFGLGTYKDNHYTNETFGLDFEILEQYSFLTASELEVKNKETQAASEEPEKVKYYNNVINITSLSGVSLIAYVDSTPGLETSEEKEGNEYLDFLSAQGISYSMDRGQTVINGNEYYRISLELDFDGRQDTYIHLRNGKVINIQITYTNKNEEIAKELLEMIGGDE